MVSGGPDRIGQQVRVYDPVRGGDVAAEIVPSCFVDPKGERSRVCYTVTSIRRDLYSGQRGLL